MHADKNDIVKVLTTNHPARPYLIIGGLIGGMGLMRNRLSNLPMLIVGAALVAKGLEEMNRINGLHDGNFHGTNGPPHDLG